MILFNIRLLINGFGRKIDIKTLNIINLNKKFKLRTAFPAYRFFGVIMFILFRLQVFVLFFLSIIQFPVLAQTRTTTRTARIKSIVGTADIRRTGTINWVNARVNMPLKERDALRTFIESELELETSEGTVIKLGENSSCELDKMASKGDLENTKLKILNGSVIANVKKLVNTNSRFEFETPTATAAIRGTVVGFEVSKEKTVVKVYEGTVVVTPHGAKKGVEIKDNQMTSINKGQKSITVQKFEEKPAGPQLHEKTGLIDTLKKDTILIVNDSSMIKSDSIVKDTDSVLKTAASDSTSVIGNRVENIDESYLDTAGNTDENKSVSAVSRRDTIDTRAETRSQLRLIVTSPSDRLEVKHGTPVTVTGTVTSSAATVVVNGKVVPVSSSGQFKTTITAPVQYTDFDITITAEEGGNAQTITRTIIVKTAQLHFDVKTPVEGQVFSKTTIPVSGTVSQGAEVTAMSIRIPVSSSGAFSGQIPIPNEDGEIMLEFEASQDGQYKNISRKIVYQPEYRFNLKSPQNEQTVNSTTLLIKGEVMPAGAKVYVLGRPVNVTSTGLFSGTVTIPEEEGEIELDFEITYGLMTKTETRTIYYKKPIDILKPQIQAMLPQISENNQIFVTVYDRTPEDEITLFHTVDGQKESEKGTPNSSFSIPLQPGMHTYTFQAVDKAGNSSLTISQNITWFGKTDWMIKINKAVDVIYLPPSAPDNTYEPVYTLDFSIENLPDNDMRLISLVTVVNKLTGEVQTKKTFTDNYFSIDMKLKNHQTNNFDISIEDIRKKIKSKTIQVVVK
jgi:hypothetical protein